jgi:hypothetical protein
MKKRLIAGGLGVSLMLGGFIGNLVYSSQNEKNLVYEAPYFGEIEDKINFAGELRGYERFVVTDTPSYMEAVDSLSESVLYDSRAEASLIEARKIWAEQGL